MLPLKSLVERSGIRRREMAKLLRVAETTLDRWMEELPKRKNPVLEAHVARISALIEAAIEAGYLPVKDVVGAKQRMAAIFIALKAVQNLN